MKIINGTVLLIGVASFFLTGCGGGSDSASGSSTNRSLQNINGIWDGGDTHMEISENGSLQYYHYHSSRTDDCWHWYDDNETLEYTSGNRYLLGFGGDEQSIEMEIVLVGNELRFTYEPETDLEDIWILERSDATESTFLPLCEEGV